MRLFPGTTVNREGRGSREFLFGVFSVTNGFMLSHIREITGLDTPVLQNWVNRKYVPRPVKKRYSVSHVARILLINMLRDVMTFDDIMALLAYTTGELSHKKKIISEEVIYNYVCDLLEVMEIDNVFDSNKLRVHIINVISDYEQNVEGAYNLLVDGLEVILVFYSSYLIKNYGDKKLKNLTIDGKEVSYV